MSATIMRYVFGESWQVFLKVGIIERVPTIAEAVKFDRFLSFNGEFLVMNGWKYNDR